MSAAASDQSSPAARAPLASVVVLDREGGPALGRCLDLLLAQDYPRFEIVAVGHHSNAANGASPASLAFLRQYVRRGVSVVETAADMNLAQRLNVAMKYLKGEIVACLDGASFAAPTWLSTAVTRLGSEDRVGAVASLVFAAEHKALLRGVGGGLDRQGYRIESCANEPYEFAQLPGQLLYPAICGMAAWRSVFTAMGEFEPLPAHADVELGLWLAALGYKVVVAPEAWVDCLDSGASLDAASDYDRQRARIRTALKYFPSRQLLQWLKYELRELRGLVGGARALRMRAWRWNLRHLSSALRRRSSMGLGKQRLWPLLAPWRGGPAPIAQAALANAEMRPDLSDCSARVRIDGQSERAQLNFGWYPVEADRDVLKSYRWCEGHGSLFIRLWRRVSCCSIEFLAPAAGCRGALAVRPAGSLEEVARHTLGAERGWHRRRFGCLLGPGCYEVLVDIPRPPSAPAGARHGLGLHSLEFN